jgi:hypothetical protein
VSRSKANLIRPRNAKLQAANLPKVPKPETDGEGNEQQPLGLPGWLRTARAERLIEEPGRPCAWVGPNALTEDIRYGEAQQGVGGADSSREAG